MITDEVLHLFREVSTGIVTLLLGALVFGLARYIYQHRVAITIEDRDARDVAVGLCLFFLALTCRGFTLWLASIADRHNWSGFSGVDSPTATILVLIFSILGAMFIIKAFHRWPHWLLVIVTAISIPVAVAVF